MRGSAKLDKAQRRRHPCEQWDQQGDDRERRTGPFAAPGEKSGQHEAGDHRYGELLRCCGDEPGLRKIAQRVPHEGYWTTIGAGPGTLFVDEGESIADPPVEERHVDEGTKRCEQQAEHYVRPLQQLRHEAAQWLVRGAM